MSIEIFNFQIRKLDNFDSVYKDVDRILAKHDIVSGGVSKKITTQGVAHSLQEMIKNKGYFDICTVKKAAELASIHLSSERNKLYSVAHCINWGDMTDDYKQCLIAMVMDDFRELFLSTDSKDIATSEI